MVLTHEVNNKFRGAVMAVLGIEIVILVSIFIWAYRAYLIDSVEFLIIFLRQALKGI